MARQFRTFAAASSGMTIPQVTALVGAPPPTVAGGTAPSPTNDAFNKLVREGVPPARLPGPSPIGPAPSQGKK
jgi:hypothetical protein